MANELAMPIGRGTNFVDEGKEAAVFACRVPNLGFIGVLQDKPTDLDVKFAFAILYLP